MKEIKTLLTIAAVIIIVFLVFMFSSCYGTYDFEIGDGYPSNSVIVTYGTPYYYNGVIRHYYYGGRFYYPYRGGFRHSPHMRRFHGGRR